jgi:hypothetical protein
MADPNVSPSDLNYLLVLYERPAASATGESEPEGPLMKELKTYRCHRLTNTAWLLRTSRSAEGVFDSLRRLAPDEDRLVVAKLIEVGWRNVVDGEGALGELTERSAERDTPEHS